jgi:hypothetical protein
MTAHLNMPGVDEIEPIVEFFGMYRESYAMSLLLVQLFHGERALSRNANAPVF